MEKLCLNYKTNSQDINLTSRYYHSYQQKANYHKPTRSCTKHRKCQECTWLQRAILWTYCARVVLVAAARDANLPMERISKGLNAFAYVSGNGGLRTTAGCCARARGCKARRITKMTNGTLIATTKKNTRLIASVTQSKGHWKRKVMLQDNIQGKLEQLTFNMYFWNVTWTECVEREC